MKYSFKKKLTLTYSYAFGGVLLLIFVSIAVLYYFFLSYQQRTSALSLANSQTSLYLEIKQLISADQGAERKVTKKVFSEITGKWAKNQKILQNISIHDLFPPSFYKELQLRFHSLQNLYGQLAGNQAEGDTLMDFPPSADFFVEISHHEKIYLQSMKALQSKLEKKTSDKFIYSRILFGSLPLILLIVFLCIIFLILRPEIKLIHGLYDDLHQEKVQLHKLNLNLEQAGNRSRMENEEITQSLEELKQKNEILMEAARVLDQKNKQIKINRDQILEQRQLLEAKNEDITNSIRYAKRIQDAILPETNTFNRLFSEGFIFYLPKDILSGDFYWYTSTGEERIVMAADCTGHGIPGAMMTMMGSSLINEIVNVKQITRPDDILYHLDAKVNDTFQRQSSEKQIHDGMDMAIVNFNLKNKSLHFAGAHHPLYLIRDENLEITKGSKFPVGSEQYGPKKVFDLHHLPLQNNDAIYILSDGFQDQIGGSQNRKYMLSRLRSFLLSIHLLPMAEQKARVEKEFVEWKGECTQTDDILVIGIRWNDALSV